MQTEAAPAKSSKATPSRRASLIPVPHQRRSDQANSSRHRSPLAATAAATQVLQLLLKWNDRVFAQAGASALIPMGIHDPIEWHGSMESLGAALRPYIIQPNDTLSALALGYIHEVVSLTGLQDPQVLAAMICTMAAYAYLAHVSSFNTTVPLTAPTTAPGTPA